MPTWYHWSKMEFSRACIRMSHTFIWVMLLTFSIGKVDGLKCYSCFSYDSPVMCERDLWLTKCHPYHDACSKYTVNITFTFGRGLMNRQLTGYGRGCGRLQQCTDQTCNDFWGKDINLNRLVSISGCKVECCQGDHCHTANPPSNPHRNNKGKADIYKYNTGEDVINNNGDSRGDAGSESQSNNSSRAWSSSAALYLLVVGLVLL